MNPKEMTLDELAEFVGFDPEKLKRRPVDRKEAAAMFGLSVDTFEGYTSRGVGPRSFSPPGTRRVWYAERDLLAWLASGRRRSTSE